MTSSLPGGSCSRPAFARTPDVAELLAPSSERRVSLSPWFFMACPSRFEVVNLVVLGGILRRGIADGSEMGVLELSTGGSHLRAEMTRRSRLTAGAVSASGLSRSCVWRGTNSRGAREGDRGSACPSPRDDRRVTTDARLPMARGLRQRALLWASAGSLRPRSYLISARKTSVDRDRTGHRVTTHARLPVARGVHQSACCGRLRDHCGLEVTSFLLGKNRSVDRESGPGQDRAGRQGRPGHHDSADSNS
jgi:hypothetical protein